MQYVLQTTYISPGLSCERAAFTGSASEGFVSRILILSSDELGRASEGSLSLGEQAAPKSRRPKAIQVFGDIYFFIYGFSSSSAHIFVIPISSLYSLYR